MYKILQCDADKKREVTLNDLIDVAEMFDKDCAFTCDKCKSQYNEIYLTDNGRLCKECKTGKIKFGNKKSSMFAVMKTQTEYRPLKDLHKLEGNPRTIRDKQFEILVQSIKDNPDYFEARPLILSNRTGKLVVIAGNQRYEAAKVAGLKEVPTFLLKGLTFEREREIIIRDNVANGNWDMDILANEWEVEDLEAWGVVADWPVGIEVGTDGFTLPDGDKAPFQQMTFTLADEQAIQLQNAISEVKQTQEYKFCETFGNENSNGNALYLIIMQWAGQRK